MQNFAWLIHQPDKIPNRHNISEGLAQVVAGLLVDEEVAGVEENLERGAAGLVLPPRAQDARCQTVVLVHDPVTGVYHPDYKQFCYLRTMP